MPPQGNLPKQLRILFDEDQPTEHREAAAHYVQGHDAREVLDALLGIVKGRWERENDTSYLAFRRLVGNACCRHWRSRAKEASPVFRNYPEIGTEVEAAMGSRRFRRGQLAMGPHPIGTSLFEFHYEYPVYSPQRDFVRGHPKDEVFVLEPDGARVPIFDWCRQRHVTVICSRCGEDITYQVNIYGCKAITQNPAHALHFPWRLGAIKEEIEKITRELQHTAPNEAQANLKAARERLDTLLEEQKRIEAEQERWREARKGARAQERR